MKRPKKKPSLQTAFSRLRCMALIACIVFMAILTGCKSGNGTERLLLNPTLGDVEAVAASLSTATGRLAPSFSLPNQEGKTISLAALRGAWVILYFYPKNDTPGCACEATEFTELLAQFRQMNAKVFGVSADTVESHKKFHTKYALALDLLSDPGGDMMRKYGAYVDAVYGDASSARIIRSTFLINPDGRIAYHWPEVIPQGHAGRVRERLERLQSNKTE